MRLVAGIDDGSAPGRCGGHGFPDVFCPLADAELGTSRGMEHLAGTTDQLRDTRNGTKTSMILEKSPTREIR